MAGAPLRRRAAPRGLALALTVVLLCAARAAAKPRVHVGDNLEDVLDSEEDADWQAWGKRTAPKKIEGACAPARRATGGAR